MELTLIYFLERLPLDFLISSVFLFGTISLSSVFLISYEFLNPVKDFKLVLSSIISRMGLLFSVVLLYSGFMASHQFILPVLSKSTSLVVSTISMLLVMHSHFYVIFYSPKKKPTVSIYENTLLLALCVTLYLILPEKIAYFMVIGIFVIALIYHSIQSWFLSTNKFHAIFSFIYSLLLLIVFCLRISYIYGYTFSHEMLRFINEYSSLLFFIEVIVYLSYFAYTDKSILYVFSKNLDMKSSKNMVKIPTNSIPTKRFMIW